MTSSYPARLAAYFADDDGKQVIEIKPATIDIVSAAFTEPDPTPGYQVLYSIYMNTPFEGDDFSVSGLEFSLDFSEGEYGNLDFGEPSLAGYLPQETPGGTWYSIPANQQLFSDFALTDGLTTFTSPAVDQYYVNFVSASSEDAFPSREQALDLPVFDFAPQQGTTGFGPIGLIPGTSLPSGVAARVVEYSDSGNHSSLIEVTSSGAGYLVNSIDSTDEDFVSFRVPEGVVVENFVLEAYIGDESTDAFTDVGSISLAEGLIYEENAEIFNAVFGYSTDPDVFGVGDNLLSNTTLDAGLYIAKITHSGGTTNDRGYQFAFGPGLELDLSAFASPFVFDEGDEITIDLPEFSDAEDSLPLTWSISSVLNSNLDSLNNNFSIDNNTISGFLENIDFNGSLTLNLTASDGDASKSIPIQVAIDPINDAPIVLNALAPSGQITLEDNLYEYTIPASTFADIDGDEVTLEASLIDGPLPSWLTFNSDTGVFSGTPSNEDVGSLDIQITATDPVGKSVTDTFALTVTNTNDQPTVSEAIGTLDAVEDSVFQFTVPENTFSDVDEGDLLNLTASLADGSSLPEWLNFSDGVFSGTPDNEQVGSIDLKVTASDSSGEFVSESFTINVANTNDAPTINSNIQPVSNSEEDTPRTISFDDLLTITGAADIDGGDTLEFHINPFPIIQSGGSLSVLRDDNSSWHELNGATLLRENESLQLVPPTNLNGILDGFLIMARDQDGVHSTSHILQFDLEATDDAPEIIGESNLSDQLLENDGWSTTFDYLDVDQDNVSWSIEADPDGPNDTDSFSIDSNGTLSFIGNADFESGKEIYSVLVKVTDQETDAGLSSDDSSTSKLVSLEVLDRPDQTLELGIVNQYVPGDDQLELSFSYLEEQGYNPASRFGFEIRFDNYLDLSINSSFFDHFDSFDWDNEDQSIGTFSIDGSESTAVLNRTSELLIVDFEDAASLSRFKESEGSLVFDVVQSYCPFDFEWDYRSVDTQSGFDDQGLDTQFLTIEADPYQVITAAPSSPYIPGDSAVQIGISYSQSDSLANDFSFTVNYDAQALTWNAGSSVANSGLFEIDASQAGAVTFTTTQSDLISPDLGGNLEFTVNEPENETGPFLFDFTQVNESEYGYVQRDPFSLTVSPSPDDFNQEGFLDLSVFLNDQLTLFLSDVDLANADEEGKLPSPLTLELTEKNIDLEFSKSFNSIVFSQNDDILTLPNSSIDFHLGDGDDVLSQPISSTPYDPTLGSSGPSSGLLGRGSDVINLYPYFNTSTFNILDFEIGYDSILVTDPYSTSSVLLDSRHDILNILPEAFQSTGLDVRFAPLIAPHFEYDDSFDRVLLSNASPVLSPDLLIEPGTINTHDFLNLNILPDDFVDNISFDILGVDPGVAELVSGEWALKVEGLNAKILYSGPDLSSTNLKLVDTSSYEDFLSLSRRLIVDSSSDALFDIEAGWDHNVDVSLLDQQYADDAANLDPRSSDVFLSDLIGVSKDADRLLVTSSSSGDFSDRLTPIVLDVVAPLKQGLPTVIRGTDSGDSITLLGDVVQNIELDPTSNHDHYNSGVTATAYGRGGDDYLIGKDGSRLVGGFDSDYLAAQLGSGTTQLVGGDGDDLLIGGENDVLIGGRGDDDIVLRGLGARVFTGSGVDRIHIDSASFGSLHGEGGLTRVLDFSDNDNIIINVPALTLGDLSVEKRSTGVMIRVADDASWAKEVLGTDDLMLIQGVADRQFVVDRLTVQSEQLQFTDPLLDTINPGTVGSPVNLSDVFGPK